MGKYMYLGYGQDHKPYSIGGKEDGEYGGNLESPTFFKLGLNYQGESGGYHTRNKPGQKQRPVVSDSSQASKGAFQVSCTAKVIIHGKMDDQSEKPATLLIYDLVFLSFKGSARIKSANMMFEFYSARGGTDGPLVKKVAPYGNIVIMETTQTETVTVGAEGTAGLGAAIKISATSKYEKQIIKDTTHATMIIGDKPTDDWGNAFIARWSLGENVSHKTGVPSALRVAIVLERPNNEVFTCIPIITAKSNFKTRLRSLFSSRPKDDPIIFDPEFEPYNKLRGNVKFDVNNIGSVDLGELWDCTFHTKFGQGIKSVRPDVTSDGQEPIKEEAQAATETTYSVSLEV